MSPSATAAGLKTAAASQGCAGSGARRGFSGAREGHAGGRGLGEVAQEVRQAEAGQADGGVRRPVVEVDDIAPQERPGREDDVRHRARQLVRLLGGEEGEGRLRQDARGVVEVEEGGGDGKEAPGRLVVLDVRVEEEPARLRPEGRRAHLHVVGGAAREGQGVRGQLLMPRLPVGGRPEVLYPVEGGQGHVGGQHIGVRGQDGPDAPADFLREERHGLGVEGRDGVLGVEVLQVPAEGHRHADARGAEGVVGERRVEDVVGIAQSGHARVLAAEALPALGGRDELAPPAEAHAVTAVGAAHGGDAQPGPGRGAIAGGRDGAVEQAHAPRRAHRAAVEDGVGLPGVVGEGPQQGVLGVARGD